MKRDECPIIVAPFYMEGSSVTFYLADHEIKLFAPKALVSELFRICDGEKRVEQVIKILSKKWQQSLLEQFLEDLERVGILCSATSVSSYFWPFVKNPTYFIRDLSEEEIVGLVKKAHRRHRGGRRGTSIIVEPFKLQQFIEQRHSTRVFSKKRVSVQIIAQLLWAGYGIVKAPLLLDGDDPQLVKVWQNVRLARHTVPSAGALYPLRLSLGLLRPTEIYEAGVYDVYFRKPDKIELVLINSDITALLQSFADPFVCNNTQGVIVISGSFNISGEKYGNRAMLYVPLEAGHMAQNIHLTAAEVNVGTVEIGGFLEETLRVALKLSAGYWPLTTVIFGFPAEDKSGVISLTVSKSNIAVLESNLEIRWASGIAANYRLPFLMVFARLKTQKTDGWACGRAKDPIIALTKASNEAEERFACECIPDDLVHASFDDLENAVDPRQIISYHPAQYLRKHFPLTPFNQGLEYLWKEGRDVINNRKVYILSDCIYFPYEPLTPRYTYANSSGTAAYSNWNEAVKCAVHELIEREAFMVVWLNRLIMPRVYFRSLPGEIQKRIRALQQIGFKVVVKDFTFDLIPVIFVFAQNVNLPLTTCAGCSSFDLIDALDHALMEVEAAVYCRLTGESSKPIRPHEVRYTDDHGNLYEQFQFFHRGDFLAAGREIKKFGDIRGNRPKIWEDLMELFRRKNFSPLVVDISPVKTRKNLFIVKVFIPGIVPISFGYGVEPCGMERIYNLPVYTGHRTKTIPYGELTKFSHPYT